ncbi:tripartite tricarboxylate transporter TctB family protein [Nonomuraea sp. NPDC050680]|uniref:tripartite tricarboxylate transporter TctB family protein n=1 Tax=Nonomuraea sp. NPDC050680 TaxID=3154630 RepID=UPI0033FF7D37
MSTRLVSAGFLAVALVVLAQAFMIPDGGGYQAVGPRAFPLLVGIGMAVVAVIGVVQAFRDPVTREGADEGADEGVHWRPVLLLIGALALYAVLLAPVGYWQATTLFFVAVARVLGSRKLVRDMVVGLLLALATYVLFDRVLGITLPPGLIRLAI